MPEVQLNAMNTCPKCGADRGMLRGIVKSLDNGVTLFADAEKRQVSLSEVSLDEPPLRRPEVWRTFRASFNALEEYHALLDENWEEYRTSGIKPAQGQPQPWQEEAMRLSAEGDAFHQQAVEAWTKQK